MLAWESEFYPVQTVCTRFFSHPFLYYMLAWESEFYPVQMYQVLLPPTSVLNASLRLQVLSGADMLGSSPTHFCIKC